MRVVVLHRTIHHPAQKAYYLHTAMLYAYVIGPRLIEDSEITSEKEKSVLMCVPEHIVLWIVQKQSNTTPTITRRDYMAKIGCFVHGDKTSKLSVHAF